MGFDGSCARSPRRLISAEIPYCNIAGLIQLYAIREEPGQFSLPGEIELSMRIFKVPFVAVNDHTFFKTSNQAPSAVAAGTRRSIVDKVQSEYDCA